MAFIRWRGRCAQLLATVYQDGRSKQIRLLTMPEFHITPHMQELVEQAHPAIRIDWDKIHRDFAKGPPMHLVSPMPEEHQEMAIVENRLRKWSRAMTEWKDAKILLDAAILLVNHRSRYYFDNEVPHLNKD